jgi:tetratricopeptide (TPR) repeat protein
MARGLRSQAREARELHIKGQHEEALARALEVLGANPGSALALNLVGSLHRHFGSAAWSARASDDDEAASTLELHHHQLALDAFSAAARIAPNCVMTAVCHAQALAAEQRFAEAIPEVARIIGKPVDEIDDPKLHNVMYDMESISSCSDRKIHARHSERR